MHDFPLSSKLHYHSSLDPFPHKPANVNQIRKLETIFRTGGILSADVLHIPLDDMQTLRKEKTPHIMCKVSSLRLTRMLVFPMTIRLMRTAWQRTPFFRV